MSLIFIFEIVLRKRMPIAWKPPSKRWVHNYILLPSSVSDCFAGFFFGGFLFGGFLAGGFAVLDEGRTSLPEDGSDPMGALCWDFLSGVVTGFLVVVLGVLVTLCGIGDVAFKGLLLYIFGVWGSLDFPSGFLVCAENNEKNNFCTKKLIV